MKNVLWGLGDSVLFLTSGMHIYTLKIDQSMPSLKTLCRQAIITKVLGESEEGNVEVLPLPTREISQLTMMREPLIPVSAVGVVSLLTTPMLVYRYNIKKIEAILCYQNAFLLSYIPGLIPYPSIIKYKLL